MIDPVAIYAVAGGLCIFAALASFAAGLEAARAARWTRAAGHGAGVVVFVAGWTATAILTFWHVVTMGAQ